MDGLIFVEYQFLWFSWRVRSTKSSTNEKAIFCVLKIMNGNAMATNFEPHECVFYAPALKGPPGASSNRIVRPSVCLFVRLFVRNSVLLT